MAAGLSLNVDQRIDDLPALPPLSHVLLNTTNAINLNTQRTERYSGCGDSKPAIERFASRYFAWKYPKARFVRPDRFLHIRVFVEQDGQREQGKRCRMQMIAGKDIPVFTVDPVDGVLTFGMAFVDEFALWL